jgi:tRNA(His) guanylyltransferase
MDSLGDRMKRYEAVTDFPLTPRMPCIVRLDGKGFHQWTRRVHAVRPFDSNLHDLMCTTMLKLCADTQGTVIGYTQSDEISLVLQDYFALDTEPAFGKRLQKLVSITASLATAAFNAAARSVFADAPMALFDVRAFVLPKEEVTNYLIWRQQDAVRNSIRMAGYAQFSSKSLEHVSNEVLQERLWTERGINWNDYAVWEKRGTCAVRNAETHHWETDVEIPIFTQNRAYIEHRLEPDDPQ